MADTEQTCHATAVCYQNKGIMLIGPSGSGKSGLALQLIALGAVLIADDRVVLRSQGAGVTLHCPPTIKGLIEARGIGILNADHIAEAPLACVVDMGQHEADRLPVRRNVTYLGTEIPLLWRCDAPHFAAGILHLVTYGRSTR